MAKKKLSVRKRHMRHVVFRMQEYYGYPLAYAAQREIIAKQIMNPDFFTYPVKLTTSRTLHRVVWRDKPFVVMYNNKLKCLITVLNPKCDDVREHYPDIAT